MGTQSSKKFIKNNAGTLTEEHALITSSGSGDANSIPALNSSGILDLTIVNAVTTSLGSSSANQLIALNSAGVLDTSFLPTGIGADTAVIVASEALSAGAFVNVWNNGGAFNVRNADSTISGKEAHGFVLSAVSSSANATVYFAGNNTSVTSRSPGVQYLSTVGSTSTTAPSSTGNVVQRVGVATSATNINVFFTEPVVLA